jgi:hypothetical protein
VTQQADLLQPAFSASVGVDDLKASLATFLLLAPLFLQRVFIGGEGDSYSDYPGFSLALVGYACHVALIALAAVRCAANRSIPYCVLIMIGVLAVVALLQMLYAFLFLRNPYAAMFLPLGRGWLALLAVTSCALLFTADDFVRVFSWMARLACLVSLVCLLQYELSGVAFGVHIARGYPRVQGFFSEPSALATVVPGFLVLSALRHRYWDVALAVAAIIVSASVIVFASTAIVVVIFALNRSGFRNASSAILGVFVVCAVAIPFAMNQGVADAISRLAEGLLQQPDGLKESGVFDEISTRALSALSALGDVVALYSLDNMGGGLARVVGQLMAFDMMQTAGVQNVGYGLNVFGTLSVEKYGDVLDFGYPAYLMTSYGIPLGMVLVGWLLVIAIRELKRGGEVGVVMVSGVVATLGNSAGGLHAYALPMLLMIVAAIGSTGRNRRGEKSQGPGVVLLRSFGGGFIVR